MDNSSVTYRPDKLMNHTGPEIKGRPYYSSVHYNYTSFNGPEEDCRQARSDKAAIHSLFMGIPALIAHKKKLGFRVKIELALFNEISLIITCI